jgi:formylglycine-generating enzyme required for sulfatase activity
VGIILKRLHTYLRWLIFCTLVCGCTGGRFLEHGKEVAVGHPHFPDTLTFAKIPKGCFHPGSEYKQQHPSPEVCLEPFYIRKTEVTQKEYMDKMGRDFWTPNCPGWCFGVGPDLPAYNIHWNDAVLYSNKLSKLNGLDTVYCYDGLTNDSLTGHARITNLKIHSNNNGYRLPFEEEWEYAYKAGAHADFFWGDNRGPTEELSGLNIQGIEDENRIEPGVLEHAWYFKNSGGKVHPVGQKRSNNWGLYDMAGNVAEWTNDSFPGEGFTRDSAVGDSPQGQKKVTKGGAAIVLDKGMGVESRYTSWHKDPLFMDFSFGVYPVGFRVVLPADK